MTTVVAIVLVVLAAVVVFAIAAGAIGREAHRLDAVAPRAVYVLDDAVEYVADVLPPDSQARLTHDEVRQLLTFHMRWLHARGLQPDHVVDRPQDITERVVVEEVPVLAYVIEQAEEAGILFEDVDLANVVEAHLAYLDAIGAVGPRAEGDELA
jgi:hypothetical protein